MWKHGTYLADAGDIISTGARSGVWRSALGTIGIYIPFKRISLGTAGKFSPYAGHVWKHGTYLEDVGGCISTEGLALGARRHSQRTSRFADGFGGGGGGRGEREC